MSFTTHQLDAGNEEEQVRDGGKRRHEVEFARLWALEGRGGEGRGGTVNSESH